MTLSINTNISSLNAQRNLTGSQSSLATSMQRLSSRPARELREGRRGRPWRPRRAHERAGARP